MAEEVIPTAPVIEAAPATASSPSVETAPVVVTEPSAPAVVPVIETPVVEVKTEAPAEAAKPLLDPETPKDDAVKPDVAKTEIEAPKTEPVPLPVYEFKLPEGAHADNPRFKSFNEKLGQFQNLSKAEQVAVQKFGQEMIDMHLEDVKAIVESQNKSSWDWFNNRNKEWLDNSKKDPSIGGDNWNQTVSSASQAISLYGGTKAQQIETAKLLQETGVENHPAILRFLSNITRIAAKEGSPVSSQGAPAQKTGIAQLMYGATSKGAAQ